MLSIAVLIVARIGMGIGEAAMFPAGYELFGRWVPAIERARAVARMTSGVPVGTLVGLMGSGWLQGLSISYAGLFSAAPWLVMFAVGNTGASVADRMITME